MKSLILFFVGCALLLSGCTTQADAPAPVAADAEVTLAADGFSFTEGPAADADGNVYFTDQPNNLIYLYTVDGKLDTFHTEPQRANGMFFDADGNLIACADLHNRLVSIAPGGEITVLVDGYDDKKLNGPNDVWVAPNGDIYFTDSFYKRPWWDHEEQPQENRCIFLYQRDTDTLTQLDCDYKMPNGIIGTPDGETLYVADINAGRTYAYNIQEDGTLANRRLFCEEGSDGMTLDDQGNVYLTNQAVSIFSPDGEKLTTIEIPERPANVCFGGTDRKTLFVTARTGLYIVPMQVGGAY